MGAVAVFVVFALNGVVFGSWASRVPALADRIGAQEGALGLALLGSSVGMILAASVTGRLAARFGARAVVGVSSLASALVVPVLGLAPTPLTLGLTLVVLGAWVGAYDVAMNIAAVTVTRRTGRALMSVFHAAFSFGGLLGAAGAAAAAFLGVPLFPHLLVVAALVVLVTLAVIRAIPDEDRTPTTSSDTPTPDPAAPTSPDPVRASDAAAAHVRGTTGPAGTKRSADALHTSDAAAHAQHPAGPPGTDPLHVSAAHTRRLTGPVSAERGVDPLHVSDAAAHVGDATGPASAERGGDPLRASKTTAHAQHSADLAGPERGADPVRASDAAHAQDATDCAHVPNAPDPAGARPTAEPTRPAPIRRPALWLLAGVALCSAVAEGASADWSALFAAEYRGMPEAVAAIVYGAFSIAMALTRLFGEAAQRRFGAGRLLVAGALLAGAGLVLTAVVPLAPVTFAGFVLAGVGLAYMFPIALDLAAASGRRPDGTGGERELGFVTAIAYSGFLAGPPLIGGIAHLTDLGAALVVAGLITCAIAPISLAARAAARREAAATPDPAPELQAS